MERPDPFPTTRLSVPNLAELVSRLRDSEIEDCVTVVHAKREGEGEWILANAAARLARSKIKAFGPEPGTPSQALERAILTEARVVFLGELRHGNDGVVLRRAAMLGLKPVGSITIKRLLEARMLLESMGPWDGYNVELLSPDYRG